MLPGEGQTVAQIVPEPFLARPGGQDTVLWAVTAGSCAKDRDALCRPRLSSRSETGSHIHFLSAMGLSSGPFLASQPGPVAALPPPHACDSTVPSYRGAAITMSRRALRIIFRAAVRLKLGLPRMLGASFPA